MAWHGKSYNSFLCEEEGFLAFLNDDVKAYYLLSTIVGAVLDVATAIDKCFLR